jgi:excisionase family DNA binding protein
MTIFNTKQAAAALGITPRRVLALIQSGRLPAVKVGRDWIIKSSDLKLVSIRIPGRPPIKKG